MSWRAKAALALALSLAACVTAPDEVRDLGAPDHTGQDAPLPDLSAPDLSAPDLPTADTSPALPCPKAPCAARPIVLVHGHVGSNDDWFALLAALVSGDPRFDAIQLSGVKDHPLWPARSIHRRGWLFAFDYYLRFKEDARGSYSAGPGRIGSNASHACSQPSGNGYLVADSASYDAGTTHDYAADLADMVQSVRRATGASEVDLVAHSMGGQVVRSYLSFYNGAAQTRRVLLLACMTKGVALAGFLKYFPMGRPGWMADHEVAEVNGTPVIGGIRFSRCGETAPQPGAFGAKLLEHELLNPPAVELYLMSGKLDPVITYAVSDHPLAKWHKEVTTDHTGILGHADTVAQVKQLLGGTY